jgi:hypothetical protein
LLKAVTCSSRIRGAGAAKQRGAHAVVASTTASVSGKDRALTLPSLDAFIPTHHSYSEHQRTSVHLLAACTMIPYRQNFSDTMQYA